MYLQRKFALFESSTYEYGKNVWFWEILKATSSSGHNSAPEYVKVFISFWRKVFLLAGVIERDAAETCKIQHEIT